ncbi:DUF427 domain-containing protein [Frankia sp. AgKG'84/4]|uniref:DUF427 domain-containing protein n=1 Tax=Frankia sp. AgKG'84/4 TaxID=573490 RepID=UPI00200CF729|nr:DUF427 domain-containing protein [Frankia sp. AgKG'84/4]MCL9794170.1 DUF427 domain-containing protein [Frankia sp. AgKG'84/4]
MSRQVLEPGVDHPITVEPTRGRVVVRIAGHVVADSQDALTLREANYPPAYYLPVTDVDSGVLRPSTTSTYCPYKGDASYHSVETPDGTRLDDVIWFYEQPYPAVADIAGYVAFYANRAEITVADAGA